MYALLAITSSLVWGTADFIGGTLSRRRNTLSVLAGAAPFGLLAAITVLLISGSPVEMGPHIWWGAFAGLIGLVGLGAFYAALASGQMGIVSPISALGVLVPLSIGLLSGELPSGLQLVGIILAVIGVVLASGPELNASATRRPVVLAFIAAASFGFTVWAMAQGGQTNAALTVVMMRVVQVATLVVLAIAVKAGRDLTRADLPWLIALGFADAFANYLFILAAGSGMLSVVSVLGSLFPVVTVLLAWRVHHERLLPIQYVGISIAMVGVVGITAG
jgi:drug/metabolite transporter (DMT)-like permease